MHYKVVETVSPQLAYSVVTTPGDIYEVVVVVILIVKIGNK
jgi:hypothetical protein